jgi:hypothetical protein
VSGVRRHGPLGRALTAAGYRPNTMGWWVVRRQWRRGTAQTRKLDWPIPLETRSGSGKYRLFYTKEVAQAYAAWARGKKPPRDETQTYMKQARRKARAARRKE